MELWEQAHEHCDRAIFETEDEDEQIELFDKAISLYLRAAEQAETEESTLISIGNARQAEANRYTVFAAKLVHKGHCRKIQ